MTLNRLMKGTALGALAAAMVATVLPAPAQAAAATAEQRADRQRGDR